MPRRRIIDIPSLPLTEKEVKIYQEIYYEHYKPFVESSSYPDSYSLMKKALSPILEKHAWDLETFEAYIMIDFIQRVLFDMVLFSQKEGFVLPKMQLTDEKMYKFDPALGVPRLKCPKRTTAPDPQDSFH